MSKEKSKVKSTLDHIMVDIETVDTKNTSAILSMAAVPWDPNTGKYATKRYFYEVIDLQSCFDKGLTAGGETLKWWFDQSREARMAAFGLGPNSNLIQPPRHIMSALIRFEEFIKSHEELVGKKVKLWGNTARFDLGIISNAYEACDMPQPWAFYNEMDVRTLVQMAPTLKTKVRFTGIRHHPVDDCKYQIKYCSKIWKHVYGTTNKKSQKTTKTTSRKKINS